MKFAIEIVGYILTAIALLVLAAFLNRCSNDNLEKKCLEKGGQWSRALDPNNSLCTMPKQTS